jgi:NAD(P)-dependent dehydrogenase (short-subunit alcohol dehydrogenase family)
MTAGQTPWNVRGKRVLITGGNSGIGKATAIMLARHGAQVVFTSRDLAKGKAAQAEIQEAAKAGVIMRQLDLASLASIHAFAHEFQSEFSELHVLVHNAGLILSERRETEDGLEATFGTNHLGPFALNRLLLPMLKASVPSRIVVVSSAAHFGAHKGLDFDDLQSKHNYSGTRVYAASKLANVLFTNQLAQRLQGTGVSAFSLHPGVVATGFTADGDAKGLWGFFFKWFRPFLLSPEKGARTSIYLCTQPDIEHLSGAYFQKCKVQKSSPSAQDDGAALKLWEVSETLSGPASLTSYSA